jgi:hypothetical protein
LASPPVVAPNFQTTWGGFHAYFLRSALFIVAMIAPASAYTDEQVSACTPDVMRLCADAIPDEGRITKCMVQKKKQVSATCVMVMKKGPSPTSRVAAK